jgi:hypothetical protein
VVVLTALGEGKLSNDRRVSRLDKFLRVAEDRDDVGLGSWYRELGQVFQLAVEEEGGIRELFPREAEGGAKDRPAPGEGHEAHAFLEVAVAGQEFESRLDESLRIERDEIGLV